MSDYAHEIMRRIKEDDIMINADQHHAMQEILAEDAHHKAQAMREGMPEGIDPDYENFISNHPDGIYKPDNTFTTGPIYESTDECPF